MNDSILEDDDFQHPSAIWKESIVYIKGCLGEKANESTGFNSIIFKNGQKITEIAPKPSLEPFLLQNKLLSEEERKQFQADLKSEKYLMKLLR